MSTPLKITCSVGIILLVLAHAITLATMQRVIPHVEQRLGLDADFATAESAPVGGLNFDKMRAGGDCLNCLPVNASARDEIKRQQLPCVDCVPYASTQPSLLPSHTVPKVAPVPVDVNRYNIALFVDSDDQSKQLLSWFNSDPDLYRLRTKCNFHTYTKSNALYRSRYSASVPSEAFPAMLFSDPSGGLVHSFSRGLMPSSASQLYGDMFHAYQLQKQVVQTRRGVATISTPSLDCPDGECDPKPPWLNPDRDRVFPLFDRLHPDQSIEGMLRTLLHPGETLVTIIACVVLAIVVVVAVKRFHLS